MNAIFAFLAVATVSAMLLVLLWKMKGWFWPRSLQDRLQRVVNVDREAKRLKVEERARKEGQHNRPGSDQTEPDANERTISEHFRAQWISFSRTAGERFTDLVRQMGALEERFNPSVLDACGSEAGDAVDQHRARSKLVLAKTRAAERASHRDLRSFCCANGLSREAHKARAALAVAVCCVLAVIIEGAINAWAFVPGSDLGWLGGTIQAVVVAGVNIGPAVLAGMLARNLLHVSGVRKVAGFLTVTAYLLFLATYTLLVAHYRAALLVDSEQAAVQAVLQLIHAPFSIYDFHTWLLVICSVLFSVVAFTTSFLAADPYPGYSREEAKWRQRKAHVDAEEAAYIQGIDATTQPMLGAVDRRLTEACSARDTYRELVAAARSLVSDYAYAVRRLDSAHAELIDRYRGVNQRIRDTPPPAYFADNGSTLVGGSGMVSPDFNMSALEHAEKVMQSFAIDASDLRQKAAEVKTRIWKLRADTRAGADAFFAEVEGLPELRAAIAVSASTELGTPAVAPAPAIVAEGTPVVMPSARKRGNGSGEATASAYLGSH